MSPLSFRSASITSESGIHGAAGISGEWIPGLRLTAHPGMTTLGCNALADTFRHQTVDGLARDMR